jgi:hypothetical protein
MLRRLLLVGLGFVACAGLGGCAANAPHGRNVTGKSAQPVVDVKARYRKYEHAKGRNDNAPARGYNGTSPGQSESQPRSQSWTKVEDDNRPDR